MPGGNDHHDDQSETALEEVLQEVQKAEKRDEDKAGSGEAGDAITPNTGAQDQAEGN